MTPGKANFLCPQGSTFTRTLTYEIDDSPVDLTGYESKLQVREYHYSDDFVVGLTDSSGITLGASAGTIDIVIDADTTRELVPGNYVYDLELISPSSIVTRLIEGRFTVTPEVTK